MPPCNIQVAVSDELVKHIKLLTVRASTPYEFVARAIAFLAHTGARLTSDGICEYALELAKTANIGGIVFGQVSDVLPEVVRDMSSDDPIATLKLRRR